MGVVCRVWRLVGGRGAGVGGGRYGALVAGVRRAESSPDHEDHEGGGVDEAGLFAGGDPAPPDGADQRDAPDNQPGEPGNDE